MKHATPAALGRIDPLLADIRKRGDLKEKSRGTFYCRSRAFLHFHEHGEEMFADLRDGDDFARFPATTAKDQKALLKALDAALAAAPVTRRR
jgi:hypothetical protein